MQSILQEIMEAGGRVSVKNGKDLVEVRLWFPKDANLSEKFVLGCGNNEDQALNRAVEFAAEVWKDR